MSRNHVLIVYSVGVILGFACGWFLRGSQEWGAVADRIEQVAWEMRAAERADKRET